MKKRYRVTLTEYESIHRIRCDRALAFNPKIGLKKKVKSREAATAPKENR